MLLTALAMALATQAAPASSQASAGVEIQAPGPEGPLAGTLVDAGKRAPIILIIPGSGPTDRGGNSPAGLKAGSYRLLAAALAERGISSVRVDKRGMFGSKAATANANAVRTADYAADARSWIKAIRTRTGAPCVWILGHSEGGLVALTAAQDAPDLCGLILVSTAGRPIGVLLREQFRAGGLGDAGDSAIAQLEAGKPVDPATLPPALATAFHPLIQAYLIDLVSHDPVKLASAYKGPMLIVQGDRDVQVLPADAAALHAARPDATLVTVPGMTHVLKRAAGADRGASLATYVDPSLPLADGLADAVAGFVKAHPAR